MSWQAGPHPDDVASSPRMREPERFVPRRNVVVLRPRADTPQAVTLELLPLLPVLLSMMSVLFAGGWGVDAVVELCVPTAIIAAVVAARDVRVLGDRGFAGQASPLLALVSPVLYLWVRARRCEGLDREAWSPVRWALGTTIAAVAMVLIGVGFEAAIAPLFAPPEG